MVFCKIFFIFDNLNYEFAIKKGWKRYKTLHQNINLQQSKKKQNIHFVFVKLVSTFYNINKAPS